MCELELISATYFLEGSSLGKLGRLDEAKKVLEQGQIFMKENPFRDTCLPLGPYVSDYNGRDEIPGFGGDQPNIADRLKEELALLPIEPSLRQGLDLEHDVEAIVTAIRAKSGSQQDWLQCTEQIASFLDQSPVGDVGMLNHILCHAQETLSWARNKGAKASVLRTLVQRFVATILVKSEVLSWDRTQPGPSYKLSRAVIESMGLYNWAGLQEEGWAAMEPLFSDRQPVEVSLDLLPQMNWNAERRAAKLNYIVTRMASGNTNVTAGAWIKLGQIYSQDHRYTEAVQAYQKAVARNASLAECSGLAECLLELALDRNPDHANDEIERSRIEMGFPPVEATWVDWFGAGRKYQTGSKRDFNKAATAYRNAIHFLENPEQSGIYHLEKQSNSGRVVLRWGPASGEADFQWSENYDRRWYSAAFYLAQCLIELDQKEEAAQWLRRVAIKVGGDNNLPLLEKDAWNGSNWSSNPLGLGVRAAEMLQKLHEQPNPSKF